MHPPTDSKEEDLEVSLLYGKDKEKEGKKKRSEKTPSFLCL